jgi:hypothetical protein
MTPVFERAKTVHALDRSAIVNGYSNITYNQFVSDISSSHWRSEATRVTSFVEVPTWVSHPQFIIIIILFYLNYKWVFTRWQWYYNKIQHTDNTHHTK